MSGASRAEQIAYVPAAGRARSSGGTGATGFAITCTARPPSGAPSSCSRASVNALGVVERVGGRDEPARPARERRRVDEPRPARLPRQFSRTPGRVSRPWQRVQSCARRIEARPDRADQAVLVQREDRPRARRRARPQRAPAERGLHVVRVDDARAGAPDRRADLLGVEPAAQQTARGGAPRERRAAALEHLDVLAERLRQQRREVLDDPLLAPERAVAVVEQEDHEARRRAVAACGQATVNAPDAADRRHRDPHTGPPGVPRRRAFDDRSAGRRRGRARSSSSTTGRTTRRARSPSASARATSPRRTAGTGSTSRATPASTRPTRELLVFTDDDVAVWDGWLAALLGAAADLPDEVGVLTGPIRARVEDHRFPVCGRESGPVTEQDFGAADVDAPHAWGANLAIRRSALERVGRFDPALSGGGDEEEWERRWLASGGRIRSIAAAGVDHRRAGRRRAAALALPRGPRRAAARRARTTSARGAAPPVAAELRTLLRCALHGPLRRCFMGPVTTWHSLGRLEAALRPGPPPPATAGVDDFLSGRSGDRRRAPRAARRPARPLARPARRAVARAAAPGPRRARAAAAARARPARSRARTSRTGSRRRGAELATLAPRRRARRRARHERREVRAPQRAARRARPRRPTTG